MTQTRFSGAKVMKVLRRLGIAVFILSFIACLCSLAPLTLRYFREDWSELSYQSPDEIITLLRSEIPPDTTSFEMVQSIMRTHGVSNCRTTPRGQCVICETPVGISSPLDAMQHGWAFQRSVLWWWYVNTAEYIHQINISIAEDETEQITPAWQIGVQTIGRQYQVLMPYLSMGKGGRCGWDLDPAIDNFP